MPNQRRYTGRKPVISSSLSNTPCEILGIGGLLEKLNSVLGTSYTLYKPRIYSLLLVFITKNSDFGTAYAHLRPFWYKDDFTDVEDKLCTREVGDSKMREEVLVNKRIIDQDMPPRRVWDLYSNRVVPWWVACRYPSPISHAWVEEKDRMDVLTPINGYEWLVPIPKDTHLDLIRIEMLNTGAEYAWLDVLCLRQVGRQREDLRAKEWKVDVPTIGRVYLVLKPTVYYFNGLGRPLRFKVGDFESDRSWFRRVWTLQEFHKERIIGGDMGDDNAMTEGVRAEFDKQLLSLEIFIKRRSNVFTALSFMRPRVCTNPVDKIAGLVYILWEVDKIPAYSEMQSLEDAWTAFVDVLSDGKQSDLFFMYPKPGDGKTVWRPSWNQVMDKADVLPTWPKIFEAYVVRNEGTDSDWFQEVCIESGYVQGLAKRSQDGKHREGELIVTDDAGARHTFKVTADHQYQIPDGLYTLLGTCPHFKTIFHVPVDQHWVVGQRLPEWKFEKVSVFNIPDMNEVKRLDELQVATYIQNFLV